MNDDEVYVLTPWGCLWVTLERYGVDLSGITPTIGEHMVDDFMNTMIGAGYICAKEEHGDG